MPRPHQDFGIVALPTKKAALDAPPFSISPAEDLRRLGFFLLLHRARILALGVDIAVDEFDHGHRGVVAIAEAGLDDAGIATLAVLVAGRQRVEQFLDLVDVAQLGDGLAAQRKAALLAEGEQLLDDRAKLLGLRQRGDDLLVLDQRSRHVGEHRTAMLGRAVELAVNPSVTHWTIPSSILSRWFSDKFPRWASCVRP